MLELEAVRALIDREWSSVLSMLLELDPDHWSAPTRCSGWSVADLAAHGAWGVASEADGLRRAREERPGPTRADTVIGSPAAVREALAGALARLLEELDALRPADLARTVPTPVGDLPAVLALQMFSTEAAVHASDLSAAVGADDTLADDAVTASVVTAAAFLPALAANGTAPPADGTVIALTGPSVNLLLATHDGGWSLVDDAAPTTEVRGTDSDVLLFAFGRITAADPRLTVTGDRALAERFKEHIRGP